jgi:hypothetical protein
MSRQIDGIDRAASRYRQHAQLQQITRNVSTASTNDTPARNAREAPDRTQVIGIPLFIMRTPPWQRQDWAEPQTRPIIGAITA